MRKVTMPAIELLRKHPSSPTYPMRSYKPSPPI